MNMEFRLAPMSRVILLLTLALLVLPLSFAVTSLVTNRWFAVPTGLVAAIYLWVWVRFRPTMFVVDSGGVDVMWPLKQRRIPLDSIASVSMIDRSGMRTKLGWGMRIGAGGLWGGFGWLWTTRRGLVQMYISRLDGFVWMETTDGRPWLITPERPERFVQLLGDLLRGAHSKAAPPTGGVAYNPTPI
jgi:Bacterial PH domain